MATYVVGDLHGCFDELLELLALINFNEQHDNIFFTGDLINGAPKSLECLEYVKYLVSLPGNDCVIGNHDLTLLAAGLGLAPAPKDRQYGIETILNSPKLSEYIEWLLLRPFCIDLPQFRAFIVHAGVHPLVDRVTCLALSAEVLALWQSPQRDAFLATLHGNKPDNWDPSLQGFERIRFITNFFTRMRLLYPDYTLDFAHKDHFSLVLDPQLKPWFELVDFNKFQRTIIFGHWASLDRYASLPNTVCIDHGCVWGRTLAAIRLDDYAIFEVPARDYN